MKTPAAFRSISEVAATLDVRQHTLRAWETRFPFVKPVKRADGRRYYRPSDIAMLARLKSLLDDDKASTEEIIRIHRAGGLVPVAQMAALTTPREAVLPSGSGLRGRLAALNAARERLAALLG